MPVGSPFPVGAKRVCNFYGYVWIKTDGKHPGFPGQSWVKEHHLVWWEAGRGRVPKGYILHHKDENKKNNKLRNLKLMTRGDHQRVHHVGAKRSEQTRALSSESAARRCTPEWKEAVSVRVRQQHKDGKFGRQTWKGEKK